MTFSGTRGEHATTAKSMSVWARREMSTFRRALNAGKCKVALHALARAAHQVGRFSENRRWAHAARWQKGGVSGGVIVKMARRYYTKCGGR